MNLNEFAKEVHENAIAHGWWNEEYTDDAVVALIHAEISEAFEEWRAKRPLLYRKCKMNGEPCVGVNNCVHRCGSVEDAVTRMNPKPEGIAVELIDVVLRILDAAAAWGVALGQGILYPSNNSTSAILTDTVKNSTVPDLICSLHRFTNDILLEREYGENTPDESKEAAIAYPLALAITWVRTHGIDPEALMREKHEYNKTRPYKHGGKRI